MTRRPVLIGNASGFYGDRDQAAREMVEGGPIDILTGDYLAELTMLILWKARQRDPSAGYARSVLGQLEHVLGTCLDRGIKIVNNAGGLNPDGCAAHTRQNAHGVDLNRNWPFHWVHLGGGTYSGSSAASEPETRAMMAFLNQVRPAYVVSFHQPLHGVGRAGAKGRPLVRRLHRQLHLPTKAFNCDGVCHGTMTEWYNRYFRGVAVTVEYGHGLSRRQANTTGPTGLLRAVGARR